MPPKTDDYTIFFIHLKEQRTFGQQVTDAVEEDRIRGEFPDDRCILLPHYRARLETPLPDGFASDTLAMAESIWPQNMLVITATEAAEQTNSVGVACVAKKVSNTAWLIQSPWYLFAEEPRFTQAVKEMGAQPYGQVA